MQTHQTPEAGQQPKNRMPPMSLRDILERDPESKMESELVSRFAAEIMKSLQAKGFVMHRNVNALLRRGWGDLIVRRESPQRLTKALVGGADIELSFGGTFGEKYLNSAVWNSTTRPETLRWAIQEGFSSAGGLFMVEAFDPHGQDIVVEKIDNPIKTLKVGDEMIDRTTYRATSGKIHPEDLRFVLMGVVATRFPREQMTDEEIERLEEFEIEMAEWKENPQGKKRPDPVFVVRGFTSDQLEQAKAA